MTLVRETWRRSVARDLHERYCSHISHDDPIADCNFSLSVTLLHPSESAVSITSGRGSTFLTFSHDAFHRVCSRNLLDSLRSPVASISAVLGPDCIPSEVARAY